MRCRDVAEKATDYSEGALGPFAAWRIRSHLAGCADCRSYFAQLELTGRALSSLAVDSLSSTQKADALQTFRAYAAGTSTAPASVLDPKAFADASPARALSFTPVVICTLLAGALGVPFARHHAPLSVAWAVAAIGLLLAGSVAWLARTRGGVATMLAIGAGLGVAVFAKTDGGVPPGVHCALHELGTGALALGALVAWNRGVAIPQRMAAGVAAAGALAGDAALHVTCPAGASSLGHVLLFHVGSVAVTAALAGVFAAKLLSSNARTVQS